MAETIKCSRSVIEGASAVVQGVLTTALVGIDKSSCGESVKPRGWKVSREREGCGSHCMPSSLTNTSFNDTVIDDASEMCLRRGRIGA